MQGLVVSCTVKNSLTRLRTPGHERTNRRTRLVKAFEPIFPGRLRRFLWGGGAGVGVPPEARECTSLSKPSNTESLLPRELMTGETLLVEMDLSLFLECLFHNVSRSRQTHGQLNR